MHLTLKVGTYEVIAFAKLSVDYVIHVPAIDFLHEQSKSGDTKGSVNGFMNLFERYAERYPAIRTDPLWHNDTFFITQLPGWGVEGVEEVMGAARRERQKNER